MKFFVLFGLSLLSAASFARATRCDLARIETLRSEMISAFHVGHAATMRTHFEAFRSQCGMLSYDPAFAQNKALLREFYWTVAAWMDLAGKIGDVGACIERGTEWIYQFPHSNIDVIEKETPNIRDVLVHHLDECQKERFSGYTRLNNRPCPSGDASQIEIPEELKKLFPSAPWATSQCVGFYSPVDSGRSRTTPGPGIYVNDASGALRENDLKIQGEPFSCGSVSVRFYRATKDDQYYLHAKGTAVPCRSGSAVSTVDSFYEWNALGLKELQSFGVSVH
jgi:hypothetical protein